MTLSYLIIILVSLSFPLLKSFGPPLYFSKSFKALFPAILITAVVFVIWDSYFTSQGIWGFNAQYVTGIHLFNLPIEEVSFFIVIPFCCVFIYEVVGLRLKEKIKYFESNLISIAFLIAFAVLSIVFYDNAYTLWASVCALIVLIFVLLFNRKILPQFYLSLLFVLIPFMAVNGILTGSLIDEPIVWYNNEENVAIRVITIPIEDFVYCFGLLLSVTFLFELFRKKLN